MAKPIVIDSPKEETAEVSSTKVPAKKKKFPSMGMGGGLKGFVAKKKMV